MYGLQNYIKQKTEFESFKIGKEDSFTLNYRTNAKRKEEAIYLKAIFSGGAYSRGATILEEAFN